MTHLYLNKEQKQVLKNIIFNLSNIPQISCGKIFLTKRKHTKVININLPKDIIKIICDYDQQFIHLKISSLIHYCSADSIVFLIQFKLNNVFDFVFKFRHHINLSSKLVVCNIMNDVFNFYSYNADSSDEFDRKSLTADNSLLLSVSKQLINISNHYDIYTLLKQHNPIHEYKQIFDSIKLDDGTDFHVLNNLSLEKPTKKKWIYYVVPALNSLKIHYFADVICNDLDYVDISVFFNCYMTKHYHKPNYLHANTQDTTCSFKHNDIFVNKSNIKQNVCKLTLIRPTNHKKLRNIITITKVIQLELEKIINEIKNNKFNSFYEAYKNH